MKLKNKTKYLINAGCFFYVEVYFVVLIINYQPSLACVWWYC